MLFCLYCLIWRSLSPVFISHCLTYVHELKVIFLFAESFVMELISERHMVCHVTSHDTVKWCQERDQDASSSLERTHLTFNERISWN